MDPWAPKETQDSPKGQAPILSRRYLGERSNNQPAGNSLPSEMDTELSIAVEVVGIETKTSDTAGGLGLAEKLPEGYYDINHLSFRAVEPVNVKVQNLSITVDVRPSISFTSSLVSLMRGARETRTILDDISADMPAGELMAIIGGSGSGKVTMGIAISDQQFNHD